MLPRSAGSILCSWQGTRSCCKSKVQAAVDSRSWFRRLQRAYHGVVISIRPATRPDLPALLAIWRRSVEATHTFLTPADVDAIEGDVERYLPLMSDLRVAEREGQVVGFVALEAGVIEMLFVDADAQGGRSPSCTLSSASASDVRAR